MSRLARSAYNAARSGTQDQSRPDPRQLPDKSGQRAPVGEAPAPGRRPLKEKPRFPLFQYTEFSTPAADPSADPSVYVTPEPVGIREAYSIYRQVEKVQQANASHPPKRPDALQAYDASETPPPQKDRHFVDVEL